MGVICSLLHSAEKTALAVDQKLFMAGISLSLHFLSVTFSDSTFDESEPVCRCSILDKKEKHSLLTARHCSECKPELQMRVLLAFLQVHCYG